ncbi:uncharacterized protein wu:fc17b08 [Triplophysa dalaica]|uniref:uncharacterized protein wu:fc17b08 n=1 Tax=Triplophysa dalaica TaxID=1582913 RepID=UPI0024DFD886|nr:uncharacterized protein wu:fc17b08 [Triplophysa dalaica]
MASSCNKGLHANERYILQQNADCWTSKLIQCVGLDCISEVFLGTQVLEDLKRLKDCKPASVSNCSFDDSCHFCCLRREKVKDHVVALNKQIVESGGKPLLGKDPSNICRLEWQSEEFLNAVLHRKEYKPRIPDPHIPVVACEIVQQMIHRLASCYTPNTNCSQDSLHYNEEKDKSLVKTSSVMSAAAAPLMAHQDSPLDLSVKKVKEENIEEDCVLDLSRKNFDKGQASLNNSCARVSQAAHVVKRGSVDPNFARVQDLQSASTLEEFMSKLCLHHQRQIVDALGFLQSEVKTVDASRHSQTPASTLSDRQATTSCSHVPFQARSKMRWSERRCSADAVRTQEPCVVRTNKKDNIVPEKPVDLCKMAVDGLFSPHRACLEGRNGSSTATCRSLFNMKKTSSHLEANQLSDLTSFQQAGTCRRLPTYNSESDRADTCSESTERCAPGQSKDALLKPSTVQRTSHVGLPISPRTARKSRKGSSLRQRNGSTNYILHDPDGNCDLVYVRKSITECQPQSHNRLHPRQNARKSTRGHRYVEEYLELKTVRTLARKSVSDASGNCPARMPDVHTSVTPKQSLSKPDSVPLMNTAFAGDCIKDVVVQNLSSEQMADNEMPGDVAKVTSQGLVVETSQTGQTKGNDRIPNELLWKQGELRTQQDVMTEAVSCAPITVKTHMEKDIVEVKETSETMELIVQKDECDFQIDPVSKEICGLEKKSIEPSLSLLSPKTTKDDFTDAFTVEPRNDLSKVDITPVLVDPVEILTQNAVDKCAQQQDSHNMEMNHEVVNCVEEPERGQVDSGLSGLKEPEKSKENVELALHAQRDQQAKMVVGKHASTSDRCLRSRGLKANVHFTRDSECGAELLDLKMKHTSETLLATQPSNPETIVRSEAEHSHILEAGAKHTHTTVENDDPLIPHLQKNSEDLPNVVSPEFVPEILSIASTAKNEIPHVLDKPNTGKMSIRNRVQNFENELSANGDSASSMKQASPSFKSMLLRSRSHIEQLFGSESSSLIPADNSEKQELLSSRSSCSAGQQATKSDSVDLSSMSVMRMPLRSKSSGAATQTRCPPVKRSIKCTKSSSFICEEPFNSHASPPWIKSEPTAYMPLRSSTAEHIPNNKSALEDALVSPGRMSLRRGNLSVSGSATPLRNTFPQRQQRSPVSSGVERSQLCSKIKTENTEEHVKDSFSLSDELLCIAGLQGIKPVVYSPPRFLEVVRGEEHQQVISNLNSKFDKMHKGWVQMDKETQPAPKPKNKADRLKEIWKSKRRVRKSRPLEQQKFSPVQMLFMKPFDLPSICRWFLQSTETKSLVIVKKVNTRHPSETQLCFHSSAAGTGSSHGIFPSLQAERLKKHLKKFAIASPVKNNPKNQRLISKALGQNISVFRSKPEPKTATRISTKAQSLAGLMPVQTPENLCPVTGSSKTPASARIIKKYSDIREKLQVQQSKKGEEQNFRVTRLKTSLITKKAAKRRLVTRKGSKSATVQRIKSLTKKAKNTSTPTKRTLKQNVHHKNGTSPKRLQGPTKVTKVHGQHASAKASNKKELWRKSNKRSKKTGADKAHQTKASGTKLDIKKSVLNKGSDGVEPQSLDMDVKLLSLEDQVLTRSQRKMESTPSQIGSPKSSTKRGMEQSVTPSKRTRTSKP